MEISPVPGASDYVCDHFSSPGDGVLPPTIGSPIRLPLPPKSDEDPASSLNKGCSKSKGFLGLDFKEVGRPMNWDPSLYGGW